jgi:hypothetical protein
MYNRWAYGDNPSTDETGQLIEQAKFDTSNQAAVDAINAAYGAGTARLSDVGGGFAQRGFAQDLYAGTFQTSVWLPGGDWLHQGYQGALLSAMIHYGTIYGDATLADIPFANFANSGWMNQNMWDTPSGGNSTVARGILGRFVGELSPYQRHELVAEARRTGVRRHWVEYVAPRSPRIPVPVVVLVGPWTGSMGEGLAIGFEAAAGAVVVGRPMAKLAGALDELELPYSRIVVRLPTEQLFHVDGTPREAFVPCPTGRIPDAEPDAAAREQDFAVRMARTLAAAPARPSASKRERCPALPG